MSGVGIKAGFRALRVQGFWVQGFKGSGMDSFPMLKRSVGPPQSRALQGTSLSLGIWCTSPTLTLRLKIAQKPYIIGSLGPKA